MHVVAWRDRQPDYGPARRLETDAVGDHPDHEPVPPRPGRRRAEPGAVRRPGPPGLGSVRDPAAARADRLDGRRQRAKPQRHYPAAGPDGTRRPDQPHGQRHRPPPVRRLAHPARTAALRAGLARARRRDRPLLRPAPDPPRHRRPRQNPARPDPGQPEPRSDRLTPAPHGPPTVDRRRATTRAGRRSRPGGCDFGDVGAERRPCPKSLDPDPCSLAVSATSSYVGGRSSDVTLPTYRVEMDRVRRPEWARPT